MAAASTIAIVSAVEVDVAPLAKIAEDTHTLDVSDVDAQLELVTIAVVCTELQPADT